MQDADDYDPYFRPRRPPARDEGRGPARRPRPGSGQGGFPPPQRPRRWRVPALVGLVLVVMAGGAYMAVYRPSAPPRHGPARTPTSSEQLTASPSGTPRSAMLAAGQAGPRSAVPWSLVGPGWVLAEYTKTPLPRPPAPVQAKPTTLYLVDPLGGRYEMYRWPASQSGPSGWPLIDWSGDRARALFWSSTPGGPNVVRQLVLATGAVTSFTLPAGVRPVGYTRPKGTNLLAFDGISGGQGLEKVQRFDLTGALQATLATGSGLSGPVGSPDGTTVAIGTSTGIGLVSNAGGSLRRFTIERPSGGCRAERWWNASTVLAACLPPGSGAWQLWLVPTHGAGPTALTPVRTAGPDLGDSLAWRLPSGLYLQAAGAGCGTFIVRQAAGGSVTPVNGQGDGGVNTVLAVVGGRMLVRTGAGCPSSGSLIWLNPATGTSQKLLTATFSERGVTDAVAYGGLPW